MSRFRTHFDPKPPVLPKYDKESLTQPDMSLTVRQIMNNHTRGHGLGVKTREGIYSESEIPVFEDISDMQNHLEYLKEQEEILQREIKEEQKKAKEAEKAKIERLQREKEQNESLRS